MRLSLLDRPYRDYMKVRMDRALKPFSSSYSHFTAFLACDRVCGTKQNVEILTGKFAYELVIQ
jgi:hypothetical protein